MLVGDLTYGDGDFYEVVDLYGDLPGDLPGDLLPLPFMDNSDYFIVSNTW